MDSVIIVRLISIFLALFLPSSSPLLLLLLHCMFRSIALGPQLIHCYTVYLCATPFIYTHLLPVGRVGYRCASCALTKPLRCDTSMHTFVVAVVRSIRIQPLAACFTFQLVLLVIWSVHFSELVFLSCASSVVVVCPKKRTLSMYKNKTEYKIDVCDNRHWLPSSSVVCPLSFKPYSVGRCIFIWLVDPASAHRRMSCLPFISMAIHTTQPAIIHILAILQFIANVCENDCVYVRVCMGLFFFRLRSHEMALWPIVTIAHKNFTQTIPSVANHFRFR